MPDAFMTSWLVLNMVLEIVALGLLLSPVMRRYFIDAENKGALTFKQSPMEGKWVWMIGFAALNGIFFEVLVAAMNTMFGLIS